MRKWESRQEGMALVISMIMLLLLTVTVLSSYNLSNVNLDAVSNLQWRSEALAAADTAIEQVVGSPFTDAPAAQTINVDINRDGANDYFVEVTQPECVRAQLASTAPPSSLSLVGMTNNTWNTVWEFIATVQDPVSGASVRVRSGVRVLLAEPAKELVCP